MKLKILFFSFFILGSFAKAQNDIANFCIGATPMPLNPVVATYNIEAGKNSSLGSVIGLLSKVPFDVIAIQEIDRKMAGTGWVDQFAVIAQKLNLCGVFLTTLNFGPLGSYGTAVFSRHPIIAYDLKIFRNSPELLEKRGFTHIVVPDISGEWVHVIGTHLTYNDPHARALQVQELRAALNQYAHQKVVVMGDFNDIPQSPVIQSFLAAQPNAINFLDATAGHGIKSYPSSAPTIQYDYIFYTSFGQKPLLKVFGGATSDHLGLVSRLVN